MNGTKNGHWLNRLIAAAGLLAALAATGCQSEIGGQILPSPSYQLDDVQYFAPGAEFKLSKEAASMRSFAADQDLDAGP